MKIFVDAQSVVKIKFGKAFKSGFWILLLSEAFMTAHDGDIVHCEETRGKKQFFKWEKNF
jgi:hypothetical protein